MFCKFSKPSALANERKFTDPPIFCKLSKPSALVNDLKIAYETTFCKLFKPLALVNELKSAALPIFCKLSNPLALVNERKSALPPIFCKLFKPAALANELKSAFLTYIKFLNLSLFLSSHLRYSPIYTFKSLVSKSEIDVPISSSFISNIIKKSFFIFLFSIICSTLGSFCHPNPSILLSISYKNLNSSLFNSSLF